jgi:hypothetical protein
LFGLLSRFFSLLDGFAGGLFGLLGRFLHRAFGLFGRLLRLLNGRLRRPPAPRREQRYNGQQADQHQKFSHE